MPQALGGCGFALDPTGGAYSATRPTRVSLLPSPRIPFHAIGPASLRFRPQRSPLFFDKSKTASRSILAVSNAPIHQGTVYRESHFLTFITFSSYGIKRSLWSWLMIVYTFFCFCFATIIMVTYRYRKESVLWWRCVTYRGDGRILRVRELQCQLSITRRANLHPVCAVRPDASWQVREGGPRLPGMRGRRQARDRVALQWPPALLGRRRRPRTAHAQSVSDRRHVAPGSVIRLRHRSVSQ